MSRTPTQILVDHAQDLLRKTKRVDVVFNGNAIAAEAISMFDIDADLVQFANGNGAGETYVVRGKSITGVRQH